MALYDKAQSGVRRSLTPGTAAGPALSWVVLAPQGEHLATLATPQEFCAILRTAIDTGATPEDLDILWLRNHAAIEQLRSVCPDLKTAQGIHYAEVLERLCCQKLVQLAPLAPSSTAAPPVAAAMIDKSQLAIAIPRRLRDPQHLRFVATLPCIVCDRTPSQAHHLRFAQQRSLGSKVSDEWVVPLCFTHHRALHDDGAEEQWWEKQGIDAKAEAKKLWAQSHGKAPTEEQASLEPTESNS